MTCESHNTSCINPCEKCRKYDEGYNDALRDIKRAIKDVEEK